MNMNMKKFRTENWEKDEKSYLLELASENIEIIEDKKTDIENNKKKEVAWNTIVSKFCSRYGNRDKKRIKEQYQRLKLKAKEEYRQQAKSMKQTGGGPASKPPGPLSEFIFNMLPGDFINPINPYDEDASRLVYTCRKYKVSYLKNRLTFSVTKRMKK